MVRSICDLVELVSVPVEQQLVRNDHQDINVRSWELVQQAQLHLLLAPTVKAIILERVESSQLDTIKD